MNFFDANTISEFRAAAKDHAASLISSNSVQDIADTFVSGEYDSIVNYLFDCHSNFTCYSPFEVIASRINAMDDADQVWQAIEDTLGEEFAKAEQTLKPDLICELEERKTDLEDDMIQGDYESEQAYDSMLDDCYDSIKIGAGEYMPSDVLRSVDPIAYREGYNEYLHMVLDDNEELEKISDAIDNAKRL